jgi:hypothetical protein
MGYIQSHGSSWRIPNSKFDLQSPHRIGRGRDEMTAPLSPETLEACDNDNEQEDSDDRRNDERHENTSNHLDNSALRTACPPRVQYKQVPHG